MLDRKTLLVKERVGFMKLHDVFDIVDPATGAPLGLASEVNSSMIKVLRLLVNKRLLPTTVEVRTSDNQLVLSILRTGLLRSTIDVRDGKGRGIGSFKSKLFSIGGGFFVYDVAGRQVAEVKGNWKGWEFKFLNGTGAEIGRVTKKWAGLGKEFFTSADNYMISLNESMDLPAGTAALLLAAGLAIDIVYKEQ